MDELRCSGCWEFRSRCWCWCGHWAGFT